MRVTIKFLPVLVMGSLIWSCSARLPEYQEQQPRFDLFGFFNGQVHAWGMVEDWKGKQIRRFEVKIDGKVTEEGVLVLDEDFVFDDGEIQRRVWKINRDQDGSYSGNAEDVIGEAKGRVSGNALNWKYQLRVPTKGGEINLTMDDWMFMQDEHRMFNITLMKKFGIEVGRVTLFFEKQGEEKFSQEQVNNSLLPGEFGFDEFKPEDFEVESMPVHAAFQTPEYQFKNSSVVYSF